MRRVFLLLFSVTFIFIGCSQAPREVMIDSFEGVLNNKTVDFGSSRNSSIKIEASTDKKVCGAQSMKLAYVLKPSGYMWAARGFNLDVKGAAQWMINPKDVKWNKYKAISIYVYGANTAGVIAFDIKDSGREIWRFLIDDDFTGWKEIICPLKRFFPRKDWQPNDADNNEKLDFPIMSFQFEPRLPGKGVYYFDCVKLIKS